MKILRFAIPGPPRPKLRARSGVIKRKGTEGMRRGDYRSITFNEPRNENEQERIWPYCRKAMHEQKIEKATGPVALFVLASFLLPKSLSRKARIARLWHVQTPDHDNVAHLVQDALKGVAWKDDRAVVLGADFKTWSSSWEGYEIWIAHLPEDPGWASSAFHDLRGLTMAFIDRAEVLTFMGRCADDGRTLPLPGA